MSYEKKMKDLMARLVSMSPEPPPFPEEEAPIARQAEQRRSRPALVFAAAAALVIVLAVPLLLLDGGEVPPAATTTTSTTVAPGSTTTTEASSTTTIPEETTWAGVVYLYQDPENSFLGNPALVPLQMEVTAQSPIFDDFSDFTRALAALTSGGAGMPPGFNSAIPADVRLQAWDEVGGQIGADMNEAFLDGAGGLLADYTMLNQLIYTLTHQTPDAEVLFTVNGQPVDSFGTDGLILSEPVTRDSFIDNLNSIFVTEPISLALDRYVVTGRARTFEGSLTVRVRDGNSEIVHEEPILASCGGPCWGEFTVEIDSELIVPGETSIELLTFSAEDGSEQDAITIPIPDGDVWQISVGD